MGQVIQLRPQPVTLPPAANPASIGAAFVLGFWLIGLAWVMTIADRRG